MNILGPCNGQTCSGQGTCSVDSSNATDGYACSCNVGYTGNDCEYGKQFIRIIIAVTVKCVIYYPRISFPTINLLKTSHIGFVEWNKIDHKFILSTEMYGSYNSFVDAKNACVDDANCGGVYDLQCDNKNTFKLYPKNAKPKKSGSGSCIYERPTGIYFYILPLSNL